MILRTTLPLLYALFTWLRPLRWIGCIGLLLLILAVPAAFIDRNMAFGLALWAFIAALILPYALAPVGFRGLISNLRLSLLPHFHLSAGLALLLMTLLLSGFLPLVAHLTANPAPPLLWAWLFIGASAYTAILQLALPSRFIVAIFTALPFVILLVLTRFGPHLQSFLITPSLMHAAVLVCAVGWLAGLRHLARHDRYRPVYQSGNRDDWLYMDFGWSNRHGFGQAQSPAGTLLLGYPDGLLSRLLRMLNFSVISPVVCILFLYLISAGENADNIGLHAWFLMFAFFCSLSSTWYYGDMSARCRLLWLRTGSDRQSLWQLMEQPLLTNLMMLYLTAAATMSIVWSLSPLSVAWPLHLMALLITRTLFDTYYNLMARGRLWPTPFTAVLGLLSVIVAIGIGILAISNRMLWLLGVLELTQLLLALWLRQIAMTDFRNIDWMRVRPKPVRRSRQA